jgi:hypothetical protein
VLRFLLKVRKTILDLFFLPLHAKHSRLSLSPALQNILLKSCGPSYFGHIVGNNVFLAVQKIPFRTGKSASLGSTFFFFVRPNSGTRSLDVVFFSQFMKFAKNFLKGELNSDSSWDSNARSAKNSSNVSFLCESLSASCFRTRHSHSAGQTQASFPMQISILSCRF